MKRIRKLSGAFLIITLILLTVVSGIAATVFSIAITSNRVNKNYADYIASRARAVSIAEYGQSWLEQFPDGSVARPYTCGSASECYDGNSAYDSLPRFVWSPNLLGNRSLIDSSQPVSWWNTNAQNYDGTFPNGANNYFVIEQLPKDRAACLATTNYRVVGHSSNPAGQSQATHELFHQHTVKTDGYWNSNSDSNLNDRMRAYMYAYNANPNAAGNTPTPFGNADMGYSWGEHVWVDMNDSCVCDNFCRRTTNGLSCANEDDAYSLYQPMDATHSKCSRYGPTASFGIGDFNPNFNEGCHISDTACIQARCASSCASTCRSGRCENSNCNTGYRAISPYENYNTATCPSPNPYTYECEPCGTYQTGPCGTYPNYPCGSYESNNCGTSCGPTGGEPCSPPHPECSWYTHNPPHPTCTTYGYIPPHPSCTNTPYGVPHPTCSTCTGSFPGFAPCNPLPHGTCF